MATRKPLVVIDGAVRELPAGDTTAESVVTILDASYNSVSLLLHGDGSNGSTTFVDNSPTPQTFTVAGNTQISTAAAKFGGASMKFDGAGDYIYSAGSAEVAFGTGDFTVEFWVRRSAVGVTQFVIGVQAPSGSAADRWSLYFLAANTLNFYNGNTIKLTSTTTFAVGTWYHAAVCRSAGTARLYVNGVQEASVADVVTYTAAATRPLIGTDTDFVSLPFNGYIDDLRVTKGVARYTTAFTPHVSAHPDAYSITETVSTQTDLLLPYLTAGVRDSTTGTGTGSLALVNTAPTGYKAFATAFANGATTDYCIQGSTGEWEVGLGRYEVTGDDTYWSSVALLLRGEGATVVDSGPNALTLTLNGSVVTTTAKQKAGASSILLSASGWLQTASSAGLTLGTAPFTLEFWMWKVGTGNSYIMCVGADWAATGGVTLLHYQGQFGFSSPTLSGTSFGVPICDAWTHVAIERVGNVFSLYQNGVLMGTHTDSGTMTQSFIKLGYGTAGSWVPFPGYIDEFRVTAGRARYGGAFTPPTTALPCPDLSSQSLTRTTVKSSSNSDAPVNFSAGTKQVFALPSASNIDNAALGRQYAFSRGFALP